MKSLSSINSDSVLLIPVFPIFKPSFNFYMPVKFQLNSQYHFWTSDLPISNRPSFSPSSQLSTFTALLFFHFLLTLVAPKAVAAIQCDPVAPAGWAGAGVLGSGSGPQLSGEPKLPHFFIPLQRSNK